MDWILTAALIVVLGHLILGVVFWLKVRKFYSLPGHFGFPVIGNLYYFYRTFFQNSTESMRRYFVEISKKYGKNGICFHYSYGHGLQVFVTSPHVAKKIGYHPNLKDKPIYGFQGFKMLMDGPFTRNHSDDLWKLKRKEYNISLNKTTIKNNYYNKFFKSANKLVDLMLASSSAVDIHYTVLGTTLNVTFETLFGLETSIVYNPRILHDLEWLLSKGTLIIACPRLSKIALTIFRPIERIYLGKLGELRKKIRENFDAKTEKNNQHISSDNSHFPLGSYIGSRTGKDKWNFINEIQEVIITSVHTVTATLTSAIVCLAVLPQIQERAWKEQYEIFGDDTRDPTVDDLKQMNFLDRFIKETIRFSGSPFVAKMATGNIEVDNDVTIPKGATVFFLLEYLRKDPTYWENPEVFDPDRFLEESETFQHSYTPFGIGVRICPGATYAMEILKTTLSKVLRKTKISPVLKDLRFEDLVFETQVLMELKNPPLLQVEERV